MKNFFKFLKLEKIKQKLKAFSLVEVMVSLIVISVISAAFIPVMTKKMTGKKINVTPKITLTQNCSDFTNKANGGNNDNSCGKCTFCDMGKSTQRCLLCNCNCPSGLFKDTETCTCKSCTMIDANCVSCSSGGTCMSCKQGMYLENNKCISCPSGYYCPDGTKKIQCEKGYYCANGMSHTPCPAGKWSNEGQSTVCTMDCETGHACNNGNKKYCTAGTYVNSTKSDCNNCEQGYYCTGGTNHTQCPAGTYSYATKATSSSTCKDCGAGYYCSGGLSRSSCPAGTYSSATKATNSNTCANCWAGTYSNDGASGCTSCPAGQTSGQRASSCYGCGVAQCSGYSFGCTCSSCNVGYKTNGSGGCTGCGVAQCSGYSSGCTCNSCNNGYFVNGGVCSACNSRCNSCSGSANGCNYNCKSGWSGSDCNTPICSPNCAGCSTPNTCDTCASGYYKDGNGNCVSCGTYCASCTGANQCTSCKATAGGQTHLVNGQCGYCPDAYGGYAMSISPIYRPWYPENQGYQHVFEKYACIYWGEFLHGHNENKLAGSIYNRKSDSTWYCCVKNVGCHAFQVPDYTRTDDASMHYAGVAATCNKCTSTAKLLTSSCISERKAKSGDTCYIWFNYFADPSW